MKITLLAAVVACWICLAYSMPSGGYSPPKQPEGYFQYINVPGHKQYEFGWRKGNPHHHVSRFEQAKDHRFRTRVKWGDNYGGTGEHYWEYNHGPDNQYKVHDQHDVHGGYGPPKGYHSETIEVIVPRDADNQHYAEQ